MTTVGMSIAETSIVETITGENTERATGLHTAETRLTLDSRRIKGQVMPVVQKAAAHK